MHVNHYDIVKEVHDEWMAENEETEGELALDDKRLEALASMVKDVCDNCNQSYEVVIIAQALDRILQQYVQYVANLTEEDKEQIAALARQMKEIAELDETNERD